jgi:hypothetical protein
LARLECTSTHAHEVVAKGFEAEGGDSMRHSDLQMLAVGGLVIVAAKKWS